MYTFKHAVLFVLYWKQHYLANYLPVYYQATRCELFFKWLWVPTSYTRRLASCNNWKILQIVLYSFHSEYGWREILLEWVVILVSYIMLLFYLLLMWFIPAKYLRSVQKGITHGQISTRLFNSKYCNKCFRGYLC